MPGVKVSYVPKSKYQFYIEFEFHGAFAIPVYVFTVQINPEFSQYFSEADMSQVIEVNMDPALLSKVQDEKKLSLDDEINVPKEAEEILIGNE